MYGSPLFWRETHRSARFFMFEARVALLWLFTIVHFRLWTVALTIAVMIVFFVFERKGVKSEAILRFLRASALGRKRTAQGLHRERLPVEFAFEARALAAPRPGKGKTPETTFGEGTP